MAKELPYFRFTSQEWQNGDISLESYELKGLFIDICAYYWMKDCSITLALLKKRFKDATNLIDELINSFIIDWNDESDFIQINFLNEQFDTLSEQRKRRQLAGSKGGKQKSSNAKAMPQQSSSYKDKDKENNKDKYKTSLLSELKSSDLPENNQKYLSLTNDFYNNCIYRLRQLNISTGNLEKTKGAWIDFVRLIFETDKRTLQEYQQVLNFVKYDNFWSKNILSPDKLRKQFDKLLIELRSKGQGQSEEKKVYYAVGHPKKKESDFN